ncbi:MAG: 50S ribosomal protein L15 [Candidatus Marinimicrobia bacterium]|jgi:large subunit ribosomal protein L15|nr:50S ribosomal protein L15 [Candidatus Neomarinimicrobiota bacterium]MBT3847976.1 50S ribosomal protein L15 [Candidatus Neomarinimicrobiota bacterium]MBT4055056.1 50S ribosomal protein L15 [Candidatus Neomarinimicrobiota bacterium]MBT4371077.1 50S ribosomal protein L15 [Candidatus Neomarinimicrobiota bacterium]MBT4827758.1 50S ribosomal protein L15 [Candidatus Neomarinimicrobiota bacterium]|tara:strand:+ start:232 stop:669 length:438 start_codon:yes stop_codon:yes gene_type:complete
MKLDSLTPVPGSTKNRKRVGRGAGSGLGRSSGRGDKGAQQRSGFKRRPWFEGGQMALARRLPKRGFTNLFRKEFQIVNLEAIENLGLDTVDAQILADNGLVRSALKPIKILANGELKLKVTVTASAFSESAKEQIEQAGGTATVQ